LWKRRWRCRAAASRAISTASPRFHRQNSAGASWLAAAGIGTIEDVDACTYADEAKFFSYRRMTHRGEADYGRHVNAIVLM